MDKIIQFPNNGGKTRPSLEDIRNRALANRNTSSRDFEHNTQSEHNADVWNREFEDLWSSIYQTIE